jgi:hypothetical protein
MLEKNSVNCLAKAEGAIEAAVNAWCDRKIRFREFLEITGLERGYIQGIEKRGLWKYSGPESGTGNWRSYSPKDVLAFKLSERFRRAGFVAESAWSIIRSEIDRLIVDCGILRLDAEYSFMLSGMKVTLPATEIIDGVTERIAEYFQPLTESSDAVLDAHRIENEEFEGRENS